MDEALEYIKARWPVYGLLKEFPPHLSPTGQAWHVGYTEGNDTFHVYGMGNTLEAALKHAKDASEPRLQLNGDYSLPEECL